VLLVCSIEVNGNIVCLGRHSIFELIFILSNIYF